MQNAYALQSVRRYPCLPILCEEGVSQGGPLQGRLSRTPRPRGEDHIATTFPPASLWPGR